MYIEDRLARAAKVGVSAADVAAFWVSNDLQWAQRQPNPDEAKIGFDSAEASLGELKKLLIQAEVPLDATPQGNVQLSALILVFDEHTELVNLEGSSKRFKCRCAPENRQEVAQAYAELCALVKQGKEAALQA